MSTITKNLNKKATINVVNARLLYGIVFTLFTKIWNQKLNIFFVILILHAKKTLGIHSKISRNKFSPIKLVV